MIEPLSRVGSPALRRSGPGATPVQPTRTSHPWLLLALAAGLLAGGSGRAGAQAVGDLFRLEDAVSDTHVEYHRLEIPKGGEAVLADLRGPGKVTYFYITDDSRGRFDDALVLRVTWDDAAEPSIRVPLTDFFGAFDRQAVGYTSALMQVNHACYMCYLPMPFASRARFVLANDGPADFSRVVAYGIDYERGDRYAREPSRLHAAWRRSNPTDDSVQTLLDVKGRGHYVGGFVQVRSTYKGWWGEGDTIFRIDGQSLAHSPGTEDEYGSCWFFGDLFSTPYCGYYHRDAGRHRMYRWYVVNPVRFRESLQVDLQVQHLVGGKQTPSKDDVTSVAFWYQDGAHPAPALPRHAERTAPSRAEEYGEAK